MAIKAVFFDAAGTLIQPAIRVGESYATIAKKYGKDISPEAISERFRLCFNAAPELAFPGAPATSIEPLERDWWRRLVRRIFEPWGRFDGFDDYFTELFLYFARPDSWTIFPEVADTLVSLRERGLVLAVISNFDSRLIEILKGLGAAQWFEHIHVSSRVGFAKPDPEIFKAALAKHRVAGHETFHVGDSEEKDLRGAIDAGLNAILVDRSRHPDNRAQGPRVRNLEEILSFLDDN